MEENNIVKTSWFRRKYFINPGFQLRFIVYTISISFFAILAVYLTSSYFFYSFATMGREIGLDDTHVFFLFLERQQDYMNTLLLGLSLFFVLGLSFWGILLSHRVVGPLHHLQQHMLLVAKGENPKSLQFRRSDFFHELAEAYEAQYQYLKAVKDEVDSLDHPSRQEEVS